MKTGDELIRLCNEHIFLKSWQQALENQMKAVRYLYFLAAMEGCNER